MSGIVIDASITLAWCFDDEAEPYAEAVWDRIDDLHLNTAPVWPLEVANALLTAERRGRISTAGIAKARSLLMGLDIDVHPPGLARALNEVLATARLHRLTAYDAAYLDTALRLDLPLATLDEEMREAAAAVGIALFPR